MKAFSRILSFTAVSGAILCADNILAAEFPCPYEQPASLTGTVYDADSGTQRVLYTFKRTATRSGDTVTAMREFAYPDGKLAARERVVFRGDNLVSFELEELQINARGLAKLQRAANGAATISLEYQPDRRSKATIKTNIEPLRPATLVNDMIGTFLQAHWEDLMKGEAVRCRYIVVPRTETISFKFVKQSESTWHGKSAIILKMSPTSLVIAALVDPLYFTMEKEGAHRVLQYTGRTTPKLKSESQWKDLDALTVFDWH